MTLTELLEAKIKKEQEIKEINEQIHNYQNRNALVCYETLIKTFEELDNLLPYETLEVGIYCEKCDAESDVQIDFKDIIDSLQYNKDRLEVKIND